MSNMNIANRITILRIFLIPVYVILALADFSGHDILAALVFVIAAFSDTLDGLIARNFNMVTNLGKFLDPLADKLLVSSAYITLIALDRMAAWIVIIIICREFAVSGMRILAADAGVVIAASPLGKIKTISQMVSITMLLIASLSWPSWYYVLTDIVVWISLITTIISGFDYLYKGRKYYL